VRTRTHGSVRGQNPVRGSSYSIQRRSYADVLLDWNRAIGHPDVLNLPTLFGEDPKI